MGTEPGQRDAGEFGSWLSDLRASLSDGKPVDVPCDGCTACCRSGKLIPVEPDEADALAHLPAGDVSATRRRIHTSSTRPYAWPLLRWDIPGDCRRPSARQHAVEAIESAEEFSG